MDSPSYARTATQRNEGRQGCSSQEHGSAAPVPGSGNRAGVSGHASRSRDQAKRRGHIRGTYLWTNREVGVLLRSSPFFASQTQTPLLFRALVHAGAVCRLTPAAKK